MILRMNKVDNPALFSPIRVTLTLMYSSTDIRCSQHCSQHLREFLIKITRTINLTSQHDEKSSRIQIIVVKHYSH